MAEIDFVNFDIEVEISYVVSKAALNVINAKFNIHYKNQGMLSLGVNPGVVDMGKFDPLASMKPSPYVSVR